ncbi:CST, telomere maintenance, complex subunit CTC1-domain-containing protein [Choanephora cucurbitarum]|nr:CST, telomere maintenance, complex subunit CTC1-domain-containing protein [Choanephora cucurbitarum]
MSLITVNDLLEWHESTNHEWTESNLLGVLYIVMTDAEHPRGTILLKDVTTDTCFPCQINYFHPRLHQATILIKQWHFLHHEELTWIEFSTTNTYFINHQTQSALEECLTIDNVLLEIASRTAVFVEPQDDLKEAVHLVGKVQSISALHALQPDQPAMFMIQLTNREDTHKVCLIFEGDDCIPYYLMFHINFLCAFQHLSYSPEHDAFLFRPGKSACQIIHQHQLDQLIIPHGPSIPSLKKNMSLSGTITRVLDTMFGLYEVDHRILLCLYHSPKYSPARPLRVQTRIRLYHVHMVSIQQKEEDEESFQSCLLTHLLQAPLSHDTLNHYLCLVGCAQTDLEILSFPSHCDLVSLTTSVLSDPLKCHVYLDCLSGQASFRQLLCRLEIYATLIHFFSDQPAHHLKEAYDRLVQQKAASTSTITKDWKTQFLCHHHRKCTSTGLSPFFKMKQLEVVTIETYASLSRLMAYHQHHQNRPTPHTVPLSGASDRFEIDHVYTETMTFIPKGLSVLAQLSISPDGRLYVLLNDNTMPRILLLPPSTKPQQKISNGLYLIRRAQWIREDLSYLKVLEDGTRGSRQELWHEYLVCPEEGDLILLSPETPLAFDIAEPNLFGSMVCSEDMHLTRLHVQQVFPVQACFDAQGRLYFESRLLAQYAPILKDSSPTEAETKQCTLILSSKTQSLQFYFALTTDSQWIINSSLQNDFPHAAHKRRPTILLDSQQHRLYPTISFPWCKRVVPLKSTSTTPKPLAPTKVYQVSHLIGTAETDPMPSKTILLNNLYEQPVHLEGVIVLKRFLDGFDASSPWSDHALQLYQDLGIGTGKPQRKLLIQLRQSNSLDFVDVYLNIHKLHYPLGLIAGATVIFYNLNRKAKKTSSGSQFFCIANESTTIQVVKLHPDRDTLLLTSSRSMETHLLTSFLSKEQDDVEEDEYLEEKEEEKKKGVVKLLCQVNSVINLVLKWECSDCGSIVRHHDCYRMCENAHRVFIANAFVHISDGTAAANASLDGERLVFELLQLTAKQRDALKQVILDYGMVSFHGGGNEDRITTVDDEGEQLDFMPFNQRQREAMYGYTIEDLVQNAKKAGQFWMYGVIQPPPRIEDESDLLTRYQLRRVTLSDNGNLLRTVERPKLRFKILDLEPADLRLVAYDLLSQISLN